MATRSKGYRAGKGYHYVLVTGSRHRPYRTLAGAMTGVRGLKERARQAFIHPDRPQPMPTGWTTGGFVIYRLDDRRVVYSTHRTVRRGSTLALTFPACSATL